MAIGLSASNYVQNAEINAWLRGIAFTPPANSYLGLYTTAPTDAGGGTEVPTASTAYARQVCTFPAAVAQSPSGMLTQNSATISFPTPTASWGTVIAIGLFDAASGGNMLYYGNLATSQSIAAGAAVTMAAGNLTFLKD